MPGAWKRHHALQMLGDRESTSRNPSDCGTCQTSRGVCLAEQAQNKALRQLIGTHNRTVGTFSFLLGLMLVPRQDTPSRREALRSRRPFGDARCGWCRSCTPQLEHHEVGLAPLREQCRLPHKQILQLPCESNSSFVLIETVAQETSMSTIACRAKPRIRLHTSSAHCADDNQPAPSCKLKKHPIETKRIYNCTIVQ